MEEFLFDTHVHTAESSPCGVLTAEETVHAYHRLGFSGFCVMDHYCPDYGYSKMDDILKGYRRAVKCGRKFGMDILLGVELRVRGALNDYLLIGLTEEMLYDNPRLCDYTLADVYDFTQEHGVLVFQAHPFRSSCTPAPPQFLDGMEVINGNPRHNSRNDRAVAYAKEHGLYVSAGSDCHQIEDAGRNGIITKERIRNLDQLKAALMSPETRLYTMEE